MNQNEEWFNEEDLIYINKTRTIADWYIYNIESRI